MLGLKNRQNPVTTPERLRLDALLDELKAAERQRAGAQQALDGTLVMLSWPASADAPNAVQDSERNRKQVATVRAALHEADVRLSTVAQEVRAARDANDAALAAADRQARGWVAPMPLRLPELPDERLPADERAEALEVLVARLDRMAKRVDEKWHDAQVKSADLQTPADGQAFAVATAHYSEAKAEERQAAANRDAVIRLRLRAQSELRNLEVFA